MYNALYPQQISAAIEVFFIEKSTSGQVKQILTFLTTGDMLLVISTA